MSQIFMSYGRGDQDFVDRLVEDLTRNEEHFVFLDRSEILAGDIFTDDIPRAIIRADYVIVVLSSKSAKSVWVAFETGLAKTDEITTTGRKKIIPISLGAVTIPGFLAGRHTLEFAEDHKDYDEKIDDLLRAVAEDRQGGPQRKETANLDNTKELTIFKTKKQETRLIRSQFMLECYLEDYRPERGGTQWTMPLGHAQNLARSDKITAQLRTDKNTIGYLNIGQRKNWLYSTRLFATPEILVKQVKNLILGT